MSITRLNPTFVIDRTELVLLTQQLGAVRAKGLRRRAGSLEAHADQILGAIDLLRSVQAQGNKVGVEFVSTGTVEGGQKFSLPKHLINAFNENFRYRLYYTSGTRIILSAEII